jgi:LPS sulfotransferase NodH
MRPFMVVGMPRTGSTLLTTGIAQHPEAKCYGELFHPSDYERAHAHALQVNGEWIHFDPNREDAIEFLQNNVFCERNAATKAVGFKLLGDYVYGPGSEKLLLRMRKELPGLQVVHITRTNYLDVLVSREIARATSQWVIFTGSSEERKTVERFSIDEAMARQFFCQMRQMDRFHEQFFGGDHYYKVSYEDLEHQYQATMNGTYRFLGLSPHTLTPRTVKQRTRPAEETVSNLRQLARTFANTAYGGYFRNTTNDMLPPPPSS